MSQALQSLNVDVAALDWQPGSPWYGPGALFEGREVIEIKELSDRRRDGGGVAYLLHFMPPPGKLIKVVAIARSDEHIVTLEGGRGTKSGERLRLQGLAHGSSFSCLRKNTRSMPGRLGTRPNSSQPCLA